MEPKADPLHEAALNAEKVAIGINARAASLGFDSNDIRTGYFNGTSNAVAFYSLSLTLLHAAAHLHHSGCTVVVGGWPKRIQDQLLPRSLDRLFAGSAQAGITLWSAYQGSQKMHLFHFGWANFEDKIRLFYDAVVPDVAKQEDCPEGAHLDVIKVWDRLSRMAKAAGTNTKDERRKHSELIGFFASARNTIHTNSYYRGKPKALVFNGETLRLAPGEPMMFLQQARILEIVVAFVDAFQFACTHIKHEAVIVMPSSLRDATVDWPAPPGAG